MLYHSPVLERNKNEYCMIHLKTFEGFFIPKAVRRFNPLWKDEDIALQVLKELKLLKGNSMGISKLSIRNDGNGYTFTLDGFVFYVAYRFSYFPGGGGYSGYLKMNDDYLKVSNEVCSQIQDITIKLLNTDDDEYKEYIKKDFRLSRGLKK